MISRLWEIIHIKYNNTINCHKHQYLSLRKRSHAMYIDFFSVVKIENFQLKNFDIFNIFAQNIDCGYSLEPPQRGGGSSNVNPQSMF